MESANKVTFDNEESFHLALRALKENSTESAILHLKNIVNNDPDNSRAQYLLGAIHAGLGMYSRAIQEMTRAVELDPDMHTAHFQLGLLYATSGMVKEAESAWSELDVLDSNNPLFLFKRGLLHLITDEFDKAAADLKLGISLNNANLPLNNDMLRILQSIDQIQQQKQASDTQSDSVSETTESRNESGHSMLLSAYKKNSNDDTE